VPRHSLPDSSAIKMAMQPFLQKTLLKLNKIKNHMLTLHDNCITIVSSSPWQTKHWYVSTDKMSQWRTSLAVIQCSKCKFRSVSIFIKSDATIYCQNNGKR
jgi:hypothetical protein